MAKKSKGKSIIYGERSEAKLFPDLYNKNGKAKKYKQILREKKK